LFIGFLGGRGAQKPAAAFFGSEFKSLSDILQHRPHWPTRSKLIFHLRQTIAGLLFGSCVHLNAVGATIDANMHHF
jgi:hypothetical protein